MMVLAFVLVVTRPGKEEEVVKKLKERPEVEEAYIVYGEYDVVVKLKAKSVSDLREFILNEIRSLEGVEKTVTLIVAE